MFRKGSKAREAIRAMNGFEYQGKILKVQKLSLNLGGRSS
jgi:hypothetical protein